MLTALAAGAHVVIGTSELTEEDSTEIDAVARELGLAGPPVRLSVHVIGDTPAASLRRCRGRPGAVRSARAPTADRLP